MKTFFVKQRKEQSKTEKMKQSTQASLSSSRPLTSVVTSGGILLPESTRSISVYRDIKTLRPLQDSHRFISTLFSKNTKLAYAMSLFSLLFLTPLPYTTSYIYIFESLPNPYLTLNHRCSLYGVI